MRWHGQGQCGHFQDGNQQLVQSAAGMTVPSVQNEMQTQRVHTAGVSLGHRELGGQVEQVAHQVHQHVHDLVIGEVRV